MTTTGTPAPITRPIEVRQAYLGRNADGDRVSVDLRLVMVAARGQTTVDHDPVTEPFWMLGITGSAIRKGDRVASSWGQIVDTARTVRRRNARPGDPVPAVTDDDIRTIVATWDRWHLNDMRAGCRHHQTPIEPAPGVVEVVAPEVGAPCPITGYRYGHEWLVEPLPADVAADVYRIATALIPAQATR